MQATNYPSSNNRNKNFHRRRPYPRLFENQTEPHPTLQLNSHQDLGSSVSSAPLDLGRRVASFESSAFPVVAARRHSARVKVRLRVIHNG